MIYILQTRYRRSNERLSEWFTESEHDDRDDAGKALGEIIADSPDLRARVIREDGLVVGEYKYKR
jgi:hypothetical protein